MQRMQQVLEQTIADIKFLVSAFKEQIDIDFD